MRFFFTLSIVVLAMALMDLVSGDGHLGELGHLGAYHHSVPKFSYSYGVNDKVTGDYKTAFETREGAYTKGSYSLLQPDGVVRTVNYIVDPIAGFQAQVLNKGVATHIPYHYGGRGHAGLYGGIHGHYPHYG